MIYLNILLTWCGINIYLCFVSYLVGLNMFHFSLFFLAGCFMILGFGLIESIREDRLRRKRWKEK